MVHDNSFIKTSTSILSQACVMYLQKTIQIDVVNKQGCKVSLQDNIAYHLEDTDIHLLVTYLLYFLLVCQTVCLGGKPVRMLANLRQSNRPYSQTFSDTSSER